MLSRSGKEKTASRRRKEPNRVIETGGWRIVSKNKIPAAITSKRTRAKGPLSATTRYSRLRDTLQFSAAHRIADGFRGGVGADLRSAPDLETRGPRTNCGKAIRPRRGRYRRRVAGIKNENRDNEKKKGPEGTDASTARRTFYICDLNTDDGIEIFLFRLYVSDFD